MAPVVRYAYRLEVRGQSRVPMTGPAIVAANHESVIDPFVLGTAVPRKLHFLAKEELWGIRPLVPLLEALGGIPVARGRGDIDALEQALEVLADGEAVALFPEGGVRHEGAWLRGAARLALASGAPLVPVRLLGTADAVAPGTFGFPRLAALIGEPIPVEPARATISAAKALTGRLQGAVTALTH